MSDESHERFRHHSTWTDNDNDKEIKIYRNFIIIYKYNFAKCAKLL